MEQQQQDGSGSGQPSRTPNALGGSPGKTRSCYGWAFDCVHLWMQPAVVPPPPTATAADGRPRCWSSPKAAVLALAKVLCLCASACSYEAILLGVHVDVAPPTPMRRRSRRRRSSRRYSGGMSPWMPPSYRGAVVRHALVRRLMLEELATRRYESDGRVPRVPTLQRYVAAAREQPASMDVTANRCR
ncbi:hypothetical protein ZWY2020_020920 [Hordeum vulgare]|nr:hypothetical protein ZWY2020_020920 [Hordeum vulgare]